MSAPRVKKLNSKERKLFHAQLKKQFGFEGELPFIILFSEHNDKYFLITEEYGEIDLQSFRIETMGMYFARKAADDLRLTIEGSQLIGPAATRNVHEVTKEEFDLWMHGNDLEYSGEATGWLIISHEYAMAKLDYAGTGKVVRKQEHGKEIVTIHNYIPKARYVRSDINQ